MSDTNFIFSIVIAVYNTEKYLVEAIESVINQTFDFKNTEIILIDDGSTDQSTEICLDYAHKFPENIHYLHQENAGQSTARNNGIKVASGKYLNFLDSDDKLDLNTLQDVYELFEKSRDLIDVIVIPRYYFDAVEGPLFLNYKYNNTRIVDIEKEFDFPQVAINAAFIRKDALTDRFDPRVIVSEDSLLINKTILKKCRYGVVSTARYMYRKRIEQNSSLDTRKSKKEYFIDRMEFYFKELINYSISKWGHVLRYIQTVLMYDIQWFFLDNTDDVLNPEESSYFHKLMQEVLQVVDDDIILSQRFLTPIIEHHILNMKYGNPNFEIIYNLNELILGYDNKFFDNLTNHTLIITDIYNKNDLVYIKGFYDTYFDGITLNVYANNNLMDLFEIDGDEIYAINHKISNRIHFATVLELNDGNNEILFNISLNSHEYPINLLDKTFSDIFSVEKNKLIFNFDKNSNEFEDTASQLNLIKSQINNKFEEIKSSNKKLDTVSFEQEILGINIKPKVSVIIPIFNPGDLLYNCLDSVINQSLKEIEIICVDDGSTDNSPEILENYAKKDSRLKIIHQENQGAGTARNKGINRSEGEFILFLDSDDWIEQDMCKKLYAQSKRLNSDLVIFDALWHTADNNVNTFSYFPKDEFKEDYKTFVFDYHFIKNKLMNGSLGVIWSKLYKTTFIKDNNIKFPKHKIYNDVEFHFKSILLANNISFLPEPFYHYIRLGQPSLQTSFREGKDELIWFDVINGIYNILIETNAIQDLRLDFINYCIYYSFDKLKNIDIEFRDLFLEKLKSFFEKLNPTSDEINELKNSNLNWYNRITINYLPIYNDLMSDNIESLNLHLLEFKINDARTKLENGSKESKEEIYEEIRNMFIAFDEKTNPINKLSPEFYKFYISILNFKNYPNFSLFNERIKNEDLNHINKRKLNYKIENFNETGLNLEKRDSKIIVSLTSFPERIYDIHYCIYSLLTQDFKPDMVILWLAEEQFPNKESDLTSELIKLKDNGLTIKWCNDIRPYKKLIPAIKEYPNDYIVTVDDDIFYPKDWLKNMWNQYQKFPNTIISSRARRITLRPDGSIDKYSNWEGITNKSETSFLNFPTGAGGTLYFPNSLCEKVVDESMFLNLCPAGDDIWFWAMAILKKSKITVIEKPYWDLIYVNLAREWGILNEITLWDSNKGGQNDIQMKNVIDKFPAILDIIKEG